MESEFKHRLKQACADSPYVPEYGKGEQTVIANRIGVSQEAVRKWFSGESEPRGKRLTALAEFLNVDESWLALGVKPALDKTKQASLERVAKGAVHMLAGMIHFEGGHSAFPTENDPNKGVVDVYAILNNRHTALHVSTGIEQEDGSIDFIIPREYEKAHIVGALVAPGGKVTWLDFPTSLIDANKEPISGDYKLKVNRFQTKLVVPKGKLNKFESLGEIL